MKYILSLSIILIALNANSQSPLYNSKDLIKKIKPKEKKLTLPKPNKSFLITNVNQLPLSFSHNTLNGNVYLLPQSNMPCLVPDSSLVYNMPGTQPYVATVIKPQIPNGFSKSFVVPLPKSKK